MVRRKVVGFRVYNDVLQGTNYVVGFNPHIRMYCYSPVLLCLVRVGTHDSRTGAPISMLPLITEKRIALTHLIVCSFHINANGTIHLNDYPPQHPIFSTLFEQLVSG